MGKHAAKAASVKQIMQGLLHEAQLTRGVAYVASRLFYSMRNTASSKISKKIILNHPLDANYFPYSLKSYFKHFYFTKRLISVMFLLGNLGGYYTLTKGQF